jgi:uncharacterized RDD family membrane protein YckC
VNWYYAKGKERTGPFDETQFQELVRSGEITPSTLVWNETLSGWKRYGEIRDAAYGAAPDPVPDIPSSNESQTGGIMGACSQCGRSFPEGDLLIFEGRKVCAACKPAFVQRLREGLSVGGMVYAGFWIRFAAKFIDGIILGIINMFIGFVTTSGMVATPDDPVAIMRGALFSGLFQFCVQAAYSTFFLGKFSATPGKMVCGLKVITADNEQVSYLRGFGRCCAEMISSIILFFGYIMAAFDDEKRALHDRICNTRVIRTGR